MYFWHKVATAEASEHSTYDSLLTQKMDKKFFLAKNGRIWLGRNFWAPKIDLLGRGGWDIFSPHQRGSKALVKSFSYWPNHFGALEAYQNRKLLNLGQNMRFCRNFCTPKNALFGAGCSKFFRPAPKRCQSPQKTFFVIPNPFLSSVGFLEPKIADFRPKTRNFW